MQFHEFRSWWDINKTRLARFGRQDAYSRQIAVAKRYLRGTQNEFVQISSHEHEAKWYENHRPYYKVYPCVVDAFCKLKLKFNCECPKVPEGCISIRFAKNHEPKTKGGKSIKALLVYADSLGKDRNGDERKGLYINVTLGSDDFYLFFFNTNVRFTTIEECLNQTLPDDTAVSDHRDVRTLATRIALTVCMLADDPDIITPDVLKDDQGRYDKEKDKAWKRKAESRARNKGVFGWSVGKNIEVSPHVRRPHWSIRHKGKGRNKTPELVPVKGCKVKGEKLTKVPTGHMTEDGTEIENGQVVANS